ncbi:MAG TPA: tetratricopeptide repeat protein [Candidatus Dormibacteraeota bacterium]|jgi:tetratricopeptide (TPR) repeat protein|nr:tetratricopeptide repeat protein [Candidatus Dormibacteraeota bacterium]
MKLKLFAFIVMAAVMPASAQQASSIGSDAAKPGASQSTSSGQNPGAKPASPDSTQSDSTQNTAQPPADGLSRDLTFPGDKPEASSPSPAKPKAPNLTPPRSDRVQADDLGNGSGESSSKDTQIDLDAPVDDAKAHPQSSAAVAEVAGGGITEFHTWDPHKAAKSVEVGDFYFKRKNYRAAEDRYREALRYKDNDAVATIRLAVSMEKLGELDDARAEYESYLRILPHGPQASEAQKAIERLKGTKTQSAETK